MRLSLTAAATAATLIALVAGTATPAPQPSEVPVTWQLDFEYEPPQAILVKTPLDDRPHLYWYVRYTVTNHTGEDQIFVPDFALYTETGQLLRAGRNVPAGVFRTIQRIHNDPLMMETTAMTGKLLQGDDNAKAGVAIWPNYDPQAGAFDIFVGGLSGETAVVKLPTPVTVEEMNRLGEMETVTRQRVVLSKTLQLTYEVPGEAAARPDAPVILAEKKWVMR